eukprot:12404554-Karenia_brevis.AAC.1
MEESKKFDKKAVDEMKGTPWQPVPGRKSIRIPTRIKDEEEGGDEEDGGFEDEEEQEFEVQVEVNDDEDATKMQKPDLEGHEIKHRAMPVRRSDIDKYGYTE